MTDVFRGRAALLAPATVVFCLLPAAALAGDPWGSITLAGGSRAAREVAALGRSDRPAVNLLVDLAHAVHARRLAEGVDPAAEIVRYQTYLTELRDALDQLPGGLCLPPVGVGPDSEAVALDRVLSLIGLARAAGGGAAPVALVGDRDARERTRWLAALGIERETIARRLGDGEIVTLNWTDDALPLPLPDLWREVVFKGAPVSVAALSARPDLLLLYVGLVNLDRDTLAWLATRPDVFRRLARRELVGPLATFGRSLRVQNGAMVVPGGDANRALWENLVGARATEPATFIIRVLERRDGRLAYLYDTAAEVGNRQRAFMLGDHLAGSASGAARLRFVRRVADEFAKFAPAWRVRDRPFFRPAVDPAVVMAVVDAQGDGTAGPAWWTRVLDQVASGCSWARDARTVRPRPAAIDAVWVLRWVFAKTAVPERRVAAVRLLQRRLAGEPEAAMADVEVAVCAREHLPALALSLDRMGISRAALYAELAVASRRLTRSGETERAALVAWQSALSIVEQSARHRRVPPDVSDRLLSSLANAVREPADGPALAIVGWVLGDLLPAVGADATAGGLEDAAIAALVSSPDEGGREFAWEGLPYRLDVGGATARSALAILEEAGRLRLEHLGLLVDVARRLERPSPGDLETALASLRLVALALESGPLANDRDPLLSSVRTAIESLERASRGGDLARAGRIRSSVVEVASAAAAEALPALAYALAMSPVVGPPQIYAEAHRFHDMGAAVGETGFTERAWSVPRVVTRGQGGSQVTGSLLGLDLARAPDQLRRVSADGLVDGPVVTESDYAAGTARLVLAARDTKWSEEGARVTEAIARGRATVARWSEATVGPDAIHDELVAAGASPWRANFAAWLAAAKDHRAIARFVTMADYYRLGTDEVLSEAWGQSGWLVESCWCLRPPDRRAPEFWLGRNASLAASVMTDLPLRLTEILSELKLPQDLIEPLLPMALEDTIEHARQISTADWEAFAWPRALTAERVEMYLLELVSSQTLVAPRDLPVVAQAAGGR